MNLLLVVVAISLQDVPEHKPAPSPWSNAGVGSWRAVRIKQMTPSGRVYDEWLERKEVLQIRKGKILFERQITSPKEYGREPFVRDVEEALAPAPLLPKPFELQGEETIEVAGRKVVCLVVKAKTEAWEEQRWVAKDASKLPNAIMKLQGSRFVGGTEAEEVVAFEEEVKLGDRRLRCLVRRFTRDGMDANGRSVCTSWDSVEVPGHTVKSVSEVIGKDGKANYHQEDFLEDFELKPLPKK